VAANPLYEQMFRAKVAATTRYVKSITMIGDSADELAALGVYYLQTDDRTRRTLAKSFDPLHPVAKLL
jgi:hypothetical protein